MLNASYISQAEYDSARSQPLQLNFYRRTHKDGVAMYFREFIRQYMMAKKPDMRDYPSWNRNQFLIDSVADRSMRRSERYRVLKENGASEEEIRHSFRTPVEMTVFTYRGEKDTTMSPLDSIRYYKKFLRSGFVSMDAHTGYVKAYVGGLNYEHFSYDMAFMGRRQVGSTTKPYLYALTMENGMNPCDQVLNVQKNYGGWIPRNGSRARYGAMVPLKWGLAQSNNWISAQLMSRINPQDFINILHKFGINTPGIEPSMVLCLGPNEVSVGEMVSAYTTFANHGIHCAPIFVTKIEDNEGNVIAEFQPRVNEVISE